MGGPAETGFTMRRGAASGTAKRVGEGRRPRAGRVVRRGYGIDVPGVIPLGWAWGVAG